MKASLTLGQQRTALDRDLLFNGGLCNDADDKLWTIDWRSYDLPYCSIYIVTPDNDWPCKIGISVAPRKRVMAMQTAVWRPLKVARCFYAPTFLDARTIEQRVHATLTEESKWLHGEWFDMRPSEAADMVQFIAMVAGVECSDKLDPAIEADVNEKMSLARRRNEVRRIDLRYANSSLEK